MSKHALRTSFGPLSAGTRVEVVKPPTGGSCTVVIEHASSKLREQLKKSNDWADLLGEFEVPAEDVVQLRDKLPGTKQKPHSAHNEKVSSDEG